MTDNTMKIETCVKHLDQSGEVNHYKVNGSLMVPLDPANRHYSAIMKAVESGELVIQEAEQ